MAEKFDINGSFEVRRMSSGSFAIITLYFLVALILFMVFQFGGNSITVLLCCLFFAGLGVYNAAKKHKNDELFIEIDATGIWVHSREICIWNNYK